MARRRVTYLEVAERPAGPGPQLLDLGAGPSRHVAAGMARSRRRPGPHWLAAAVALTALVGWLSRPAPEGLDRPERAPIARAEVRAEGPVAVGTAQVVAAPWSGVLEHHPDPREPDDVDRVHVIGLSTRSALDGRAANALLVVDATRRAFGRPGAWNTDQRHVRILGVEPGTGLRSLQWDTDGYGLSLTTVGLELVDQRRLAEAVWLPAGPSLLVGQAPRVDDGVLRELGLRITERRSGPATLTGSPLIGQTGGASIEGQLHQRGARALLVSVVQAQLADAEAVRRALGPAAAVTVRGVSRITAAAAVAHPGDAPRERRIRGWTRLVLDHADGVTIELSSDVLGVDELMAAAGSIDLDRLARTAVPLAGA